MLIRASVVRFLGHQDRVLKLLCSSMHEDLNKPIQLVTLEGCSQRYLYLSLNVLQQLVSVFLYETN